jgi:hypothetical protein
LHNHSCSLKPMEYKLAVITLAGKISQSNTENA